MKYCSKCRLTVSLSVFSKNITQKDGYSNYCKPCKAEADKAYRLQNKEKIKELKQQYYLNTIDQQKEKRKQDYLANPNSYKTRAKEWKRNNKAKHNASCMFRHAKKLKATPSWLTAEQKQAIECKYSVAKMLTLYGTQNWEVDHVIPLQGEDVCGLHVPWNLQVITEAENCRKRNKYNKQ